MAYRKISRYMGKNFALIAEGPTDYLILNHIIGHYCGSDNIVNQIQPPVDCNGNQLEESIGGWNQVLLYCKREEDLKEILCYNDYIIFQIDTDVCEIPFSVNRTVDGHVLDEEELCRAIEARLLSDIPESIDRSKILFAICVNTIECWLLPYCCITEARKKHINQCLRDLNQELNRMNIRPIGENKNAISSRASYLSVLDINKKKESIERCASYHPGFRNLLNSLKAVQEADNDMIESERENGVMSVVS